VTFTDLLVVHAIASVGLLAALWLIIGVQQVRGLLAHWAVALSRPRVPPVDRRQPLNSASWAESA
jgi:hypothetical protein